MQLAGLSVEILALPPVGAICEFTYAGVTYTSVAATTRIQPYQFTIPANLEDVSTNIKNALYADYAITKIEILDFSEGLQINALVSEGNFTYTGDAIISEVEIFAPTTVDEDVSPPAFVLVGHDYTALSFIDSPCINTRANLYQNNGVEPYTYSHALGAGTGLSFIFPRNSLDRLITVTDSIGAVSTIQINNVFIYSIVSVNLEYSLSGATVTIQAAETGAFGDYRLGLTYSLDGLTFQTSPVFPGIIEGEYTAYMLDSLGCLKSTSFSVLAPFEVRPDEFFDIEITNPLRFLPVIVSEFQNYDNTLFNNLVIPNTEKRYFRQPFNIGDVVSTQIKTNYRNISVDIIDCEGNVETIIPELKIQNVGLKDKRDCYIKAGAAGKANVAFVSGNIYDPSTSEITNTYFIGNGRLPTFCQVGMTLNIESTNVNGVFIVEAIVYDNDLNSWVMQIDGVFISAVETGVCLSIYNLEQFDIYEFAFTSTDGQYYAEITATDDNYTPVLWKSEPFFFADQDQTVTIDYSSSENILGIDYRTDINYRLLVPARFAKYNNGGKSENFTSDNGNRQIQKSIYIRNLILETSYIPMWLAEKVVLATMHTNLKINGVDVVIVEKAEVKGREDQNNPFYTLTATFEQQKQLIVSSSTGIVSGQRSVLAVGDNIVLEV